MVKAFDKNALRKVRKRRSKKVWGTFERPRVVSGESNRYLWFQVIDDTVGHTLLSFSTQYFTEIEIKKIEEKIKEAGGKWKMNSQNYSRKNEIYAGRLGEILAEMLEKIGKKNIVFDRNGRPYPKKEKQRGKLKVFCETARNLGINF